MNNKAIVNKPTAKTVRRSARVIITKGNGVHAPVILCEHCGRPVGANGIALWKRRGGPVYHAHKGECDRALQAKHGERLLWCRLADHIDDMRHNTIDAKEVQS